MLVNYRICLAKTQFYGILLCTDLVKWFVIIFFFQAEDGIRDTSVTGVQTCALPISQELVIRLIISSIDLRIYKDKKGNIIKANKMTVAVAKEY